MKSYFTPYFNEKGEECKRWYMRADEVEIAEQRARALEQGLTWCLYHDTDGTVRRHYYPTQSVVTYKGKPTPRIVAIVKHFGANAISQELAKIVSGGKLPMAALVKEFQDENKLAKYNHVIRVLSDEASD